MKRILYVLVMISFVVSCISSTNSPVPTDSAIPSLASTNTQFPIVPKELSTSTSAAPTVTITPMSVVPISASQWTLNELNAGTEMKRLNVFGTGTPHAIKFSPDGKLLAVGTGRGVYLYDGTTFEQSGFMDVNDSISSLAFSPDGNVLAIGIDGKASLWNVASGQNILELEGGMISISSLAYGRGGYVAALGGECRGCGTPVLGMILWDARTGRQIYAEHEIPYSTSALTFTQDGKQLVFGGNRGVTIIESQTGALISSYNGSKDSHFPYNLVLTNDGSHLIVSTYFFNELTMIADIATREEERLSHCGLYLTRANEVGACSNQKRIVIFDGGNGQEIKSFDIDLDAAALGEMFALSPDGRFLVYYGKTGIYVIDAETGENIKTIQMTDFEVAQSGLIEINDIEKYAVAALTDSGQVDIFDMQTGELMGVLKLDCCEITGFNFGPDRRTIATIDKNTLRLWDLQTGAAIYEIDLKEDFSGPIAFSPSGLSVFLTHIAGNKVLEFDLQSGQSKTYESNSYAFDYADPFVVENYHFNTQSHLVMLSYEKNGEEQYPLFRDVVTDQLVVLPYNAYPDPRFLEAFSFSSDGQYIAVGNPTGIFVWNVGTLKLQSEFAGHEWRTGDGWFGKIRSLIFNPQTHLLVSVGWDQTTRLWNVSTGTELRRLNVCCSASFTPDGRYLVTAGDGVIRVWGIP